jgi:hypothetical protein
MAGELQISQSKTLLFLTVSIPMLRPKEEQKPPMK